MIRANNKSFKTRLLDLDSRSIELNYLLTRSSNWNQTYKFILTITITLTI